MFLFNFFRCCQLISKIFVTFSMSTRKV
jgi:hypothetical protein